jgi:hypothetical protein
MSALPRVPLVQMYYAATVEKAHFLLVERHI